LQIFFLERQSAISDFGSAFEKENQQLAIADLLSRKQIRNRDFLIYFLDFSSSLGNANPKWSIADCLFGKQMRNGPLQIYFSESRSAIEHFASYFSKAN